MHRLELVGPLLVGPVYSPQIGIARPTKPPYVDTLPIRRPQNSSAQRPSSQETSAEHLSGPRARKRANCKRTVPHRCQSADRHCSLGARWQAAEDGPGGPDGPDGQWGGHQSGPSFHISCNLTLSARTDGKSESASRPTAGFADCTILKESRGCG
jgi:hypothetical protein